MVVALIALSSGRKQAAANVATHFAHFNSLLQSHFNQPQHVRGCGSSFSCRHAARRLRTLRPAPIRGLPRTVAECPTLPRAEAATRPAQKSSSGNIYCNAKRNTVLDRLACVVAAGATTGTRCATDSAPPAETLAGYQLRVRGPRVWLTRVPASSFPTRAAASATSPRATSLAQARRRRRRRPHTTAKWRLRVTSSVRWHRGQVGTSTPRLHVRQVAGKTEAYLRGTGRDLPTGALVQ